MAYRIVKRSEQADGGFNGGEIVEKKPIGFPQDGGIVKPYSNLFYWAHGWSEKGSTIGLHPHQGFEILSFVLTGSMEHYDTRIDSWKKLDTGAVQIKDPEARQPVTARIEGCNRLVGIHIIVVHMLPAAEIPDMGPVVRCVHPGIDGGREAMGFAPFPGCLSARLFAQTKSDQFQ